MQENPRFERGTESWQSRKTKVNGMKRFVKIVCGRKVYGRSRFDGAKQRNILSREVFIC